jgi:hypothetical protein
VHYEYDEPIVVPQRRKASICADDLLQIPAALVQSLRRAVQFGNIQQMQDVAADIAHDHPEVSAVLSDLISRYDYDELNRLLKQNQGES